MRKMKNEHNTHTKRQKRVHTRSDSGRTETTSKNTEFPGDTRRSDEISGSGQHRYRVIEGIGSCIVKNHIGSLHPSELTTDDDSHVANGGHAMQFPDIRRNRSVRPNTSFDVEDIKLREQNQSM
jgi:hypothetical protein